MTTFFDVITVTCFIALVIAFFQFTDRDPKRLLHFGLAGILFAVANQLGNHDQSALAFVLIVAGAGYAVFRFRY